MVSTRFQSTRTALASLFCVQEGFYDCWASPMLGCTPLSSIVPSLTCVISGLPGYCCMSPRHRRGLNLNWFNTSSWLPFMIPGRCSNSLRLIIWWGFSLQELGFLLQVTRSRLDCTTDAPGPLVWVFAWCRRRIYGLHAFFMTFFFIALAIIEV